ncbi:MAG: hypothetical protein AB7N61_12350 [Acidimicrobiia bacterium]
MYPAIQQLVEQGRRCCLDALAYSTALGRGIRDTGRRARNVILNSETVPFEPGR